MCSKGVWYGGVGTGMKNGSEWCCIIVTVACGGIRDMHMQCSSRGRMKFHYEIYREKTNHWNTAHTHLCEI